MAKNPVTQIIISAKDEASSVFSGLKAHAGKIAGAIAGYFSAKLFGDVVGAARDFETAMSAVQAASGATGAELQALRAAAEEAGASTKYSAVEAANALETLSKAGLSASESAQALPAVLDLASAGGVELGAAADYVTKAVNGMGLEFSEAGRVADVLAMGANASSTSVEGLAGALSYAAPLANTLGLSLEQTVAIIGKFADAGIDASRAGTALNAILAQFSNPASTFRKELAAAGITTGDFDEALRQLAASGPAGQRAINAVGTEAGPALRALLNQGIGSLDELKAKLDQSAGSARTFAETMSNNLDGATKGFGSAWDALLIKLGTPVLETLATQINAVSDRLRAFVADGTATAFGNALKSAFEAGGKWAADFVSKIDFTAVAASLQAFAARMGEVFTTIGQHASTAGNTLQTAYGVMSAGINSVLAVVYKLGEGMSWLTSAFLADLATITQGLAKITFGDISAGFASAAESMRTQAQAAYSVFEAFGQKAGEAFDAATQGALQAREGWNGLTTAATEAATATTTALQQVETQAGLTADQVEALGDGAVVMGGKVVEAGTQAAAAAGNVQTLGTAANQAAAGVADLEASAEQVASAFERLGVTSTAELARIAANAKRDFETIRNSGTASTEDIRRAFAAYAARAIEANKGVADYTLRAQAAMYDLQIQADHTGKSIVLAMGEAQASTSELAETADRAAASYASLGQEIETLPSLQKEGTSLIGKSFGMKGASILDRAIKNGAEIDPEYADEFQRLAAQYEALYIKRAQAGGFGSATQYFKAMQRAERAAIADAMESIKRGEADAELARLQEMNDAYNNKMGVTDVMGGLPPLASGRDYARAYQNAQKSALSYAEKSVTQKTYTVNVNLGKKPTQINASSQQDADALVALLGQLEAEMSRA